MRRPVCVPCAVEMEPIKNDALVDYLSPGPWRKHSGDQYRCPKCLHEIVTGIASHHFFDVGEDIALSIHTGVDVSTAKEMAATRWASWKAVVEVTV